MPNYIVNRLRNDPDEVHKQLFAFEVIPEWDYHTQIGGRSSITASWSPLANDKKIVKLTVSKDRGGRDYYFPFVKNGFGRCDVPYNAPEGTLIVTPGMNGCSLQVDRTEDICSFIHCADGIGAANQATVCRIDYKHYAGPKGLGLKWHGFDECNEYFFYSLITVKNKAQWRVYASGVFVNARISGGKGRVIPSSWANLDGFVYRVTSF